MGYCKRQPELPAAVHDEVMARSKASLAEIAWSLCMRLSGAEDPVEALRLFREEDEALRASRRAVPAVPVAGGQQ